MALLRRLLLLLYSASCKQSEKYYDDGYNYQQPYDGAKAEYEKAQKPQYDKNRSNDEKKIKCFHFEKPYLLLTCKSNFKMCGC